MFSLSSAIVKLKSSGHWDKLVKTAGDVGTGSMIDARKAQLDDCSKTAMEVSENVSCEQLAEIAQHVPKALNRNQQVRFMELVLAELGTMQCLQSLKVIHYLYTLLGRPWAH